MLVTFLMALILWCCWCFCWADFVVVLMFLIELILWSCLCCFIVKPDLVMLVVVLLLIRSDDLFFHSFILFYFRDALAVFVWQTAYRTVFGTKPVARRINILSLQREISYHARKIWFSTPVRMCVPVRTLVTLLSRFVNARKLTWLATGHLTQTSMTTPVTK